MVSRMGPMWARIGGQRSGGCVIAASTRDWRWRNHRSGGCNIMATVERGCDNVAKAWRRPRRQGYEAGGWIAIAIGTCGQGGQGRIMIDDIQNLRLDLIDLAIDGGNRRRRRGVDAAHQGGFLTQETDDVIDIVESVPADPLVRDSVQEAGLGHSQIIDDGLLVAGIHAAKELCHGIVEDDPCTVYCVDEGRDAAIGCRREGVATRQHISPHVSGVRRQYLCRAIDEICIPGLEAGDQFVGGRSLDAVEGKFVVEAGREQPALSR